MLRVAGEGAAIAEAGDFAPELLGQGFAAALDGGAVELVGDGADELFGGYSFMWGCADDEVLWKERRDSM